MKRQINESERQYAGSTEHARKNQAGGSVREHQNDHAGGHQSAQSREQKRKRYQQRQRRIRRRRMIIGTVTASFLIIIAVVIGAVAARTNAENRSSDALSTMSSSTGTAGEQTDASLQSSEALQDESVSADSGYTSALDSTYLSAKDLPDLTEEDAEGLVGDTDAAFTTAYAAIDSVDTLDAESSYDPYGNDNSNDSGSYDISAESTGTLGGYLYSDNDGGTSRGISSNTQKSAEQISEITSLMTGFGGVTLTDHVKNLLAEALDTTNGNDFSFLLADLTDNKGIAYNIDEDFYSASSIKGPYVASLVASDPDILSDNQESSEIENILLYSDNTCYVRMLNTYGFTPLMDWSDEAGADLEITAYDYTYYSARTLAKLWIRNYEYFTSDTTGKQLAEEFEQPETSSIHETLGDMYTTQSKAGWIADPDCSSTCDAGIVYADNGPYVLVVMSDLPASLESLDPLVTLLDQLHSYM